MSVYSPCVHRCRLDDQKVCISCKRTVDEIVNWGTMDAHEKVLVLKRLHHNPLVKAVTQLTHKPEINDSGNYTPLLSCPEFYVDVNDDG